MLSYALAHKHLWILQTLAHHTKSQWLCLKECVCVGGGELGWAPELAATLHSSSQGCFLLNVLRNEKGVQEVNCNVVT